MDLQNLQASPLVAAAKEARRPTRWWLAALFGVLVGIIVAGGLGIGIYTTYVKAPEGSIAAQIGEIFSNGASLVALWLWLRFKEVRPFSSLGFRGSDALRRFLTGLGIGAGLLTLSVLALRVLGNYQSVPGASGLSGWAALLPVVLLVLMWTVQSSTEEILMRGYLVQTGALQLPGLIAILIPALIFSGLHFVTSGPKEPVAIVNIVLFALFTSFIALRQGSLWMVCGVHAGWNWFQGNVFGVPVSGNVYTTTLFPLGPTANASHLLSGGAFGVEGSLMVTIIWGISTLIAYRYFRSASKV
ncbi:hypothetical protein BH10CHL1_BH10CHL1_45970 [soil metagenome]